MKEEPDDGRTFQSLIDGLDSGAIDPLSEFLKLDTIHWPGVTNESEEYNDFEPTFNNGMHQSNESIECINQSSARARLNHLRWTTHCSSALDRCCASIRTLEDLTHFPPLHILVSPSHIHIQSHYFCDSTGRNWFEMAPGSREKLPLHGL